MRGQRKRRVPIRSGHRNALLTHALLLAALCQFSACRRPEPLPPAGRVMLNPAGLRGADALEETARFLAVGPRVSGTAGGEAAAEYLRLRLEQLGIPATLDVFTETTPSGSVTFRNVSGIVPGAGNGLIILGSHYDTKSGIADSFIGANDSGSSTGLLLALGRFLKQSPRLDQDVLLVFFDGEECVQRYGAHDGLHGSRYLAKRLMANGRRNAVSAVIILDMIGDRDLTVTLPRNGSRKLTRLVLDTARQQGVRKHFGLARGTILDDHVPFLEIGVPAVVLIDFEYGSAPRLNDYWHTEADTLDKLSAESLERVGRVVVGVLNELTRTAQAPTS